jgi:NAD(P)-dependent dehydrogenase (short-subunit alcohol dehydrogenase family)
MNHPAFASNHVAVVTGAASGIGLAAARRFAGLGMNVVLADLPGERLDKAARDTAALSPHGRDSVAAIPADVASLESLQSGRRSRCLAAFTC